MAASRYASTEETTNANRATRLLLGPCTDQLRDVLCHHIPPSTLPQVIVQKISNLPRLTAQKLKLILPRGSTYTGNYGDMDIPLLYILLRNICDIPPHSNGWGNDPDPTDRSLSANIERIRTARNQWVHSSSPFLSNADFNRIWATVRSAVVDLDSFLNNGNHYEREVDFLRHETMDPVRDLHYMEELRKRSEEDAATAKGPEEIHKEKELLRNAKKYLESGKTTKIRHGRGILIGCAGAGKTSLIRRLQGKDLENIESTVGLEVHHQTFDITDGSLKVTKEREIKNLIKIPKQKEETKGKNMQREFDTENLGRKKQEKKKKIQENIKEEKQQGEDKGGEEEEKEEEENEEDVQKQEEELLEILEKVENHTTLSITDLAGQFSYYASHQIYIRKKSFFILVVSLTQKFEDTVDDKDKSEEETSENEKRNIISKWKYRDYLKFWINSIKMFGSTESKVCLVFTHADEVPEDQAKTKFHRCFWNILSKEKWFHKCVGEREYTLSLQHGASTDEAKENSNSESLENLKKALVEIVNDGIDNREESTAGNVCTSWAVLEQKLKKGGRKLMTLNEIRNINESLPEEYQLKSEEEMRVFLSLFHHHGFLLYFDEANLKDYVILDIQWFAQAFGTLIADESQISGYINRCYDDWKQYNSTGNLTNQLIEALWKGSDYMDHRDALFGYMTKLKMLVEIHENDEKSYYIPCMNKMPFNPKEEIQDENMEKSSILSFKFSSYTLFLFYRLVAHCMNTLGWKIRENEDKKYLFETAAIFENDDNHTILLGTENEEIQLQVMRKKDLRIKRGVCYRIGIDIEKALNSLREILIEEEMKFERGFKCKNDFCDKTDKTFTNAPATRTTDGYIQCHCCAEKHTIVVDYWQKEIAEDLCKKTGRNLDDRTRFAKIGMAINDVLTQTLRDILESEISSDQIFIKVSPTPRYDKLRVEQQDVLIGAKKSGYKDFDITLLCTLIRNYCSKIPKPTKRWGLNTPPAAGEITVGDDVERIRLIRNKVYGHVSSASTSQKEFDKNWSIISDICKRLETYTGSSYLNELDDIKKVSLREDRQEAIIEQIKVVCEHDPEILKKMETMETGIFSIQADTKLMRADLLEIKTAMTCGKTDEQESKQSKSCIIL